VKQCDEMNQTLASLAILAGSTNFVSPASLASVASLACLASSANFVSPATYLAYCK